MTRYWFKPKRYGYGATPVTWEGWAFTGLVVAILAGSGLLLLGNGRAPDLTMRLGLGGRHRGPCRPVGDGDESQDRRRLAVAVGTRLIRSRLPARCRTPNPVLPDRRGARRRSWLTKEDET